MFAKIFLFFCLTVLFLAAGGGQAVAAGGIMSIENAQAVTSSKTNPGDIIEPAVSQEEAVRIARSVFPEMLEGKDLQVQLDDFMEAGQRVWQVSWNSRNPSPVRQPEHVNITLDAQTGDLLNADFWMETESSGSDTNLVCREEAGKKAEEFVKKIRPAEFGRTRLNQKQYPEYYGPPGTMKQIHSFNWQRFESGIAVEGDGITVGVDAFTGQIQHYSLRWRRAAEFPAPVGVMEAGALARRALGDLGLYLGYGVREDAGTGPRGVPDAFLVYRLNGNSPYFDPQTGEPVDGTGKKIAPEKAKRFKQLPVPGAGTAGVDPPEASGAKISEDVSVDPANGEIRRYSCRWHRASFPDPAKALQTEDTGKMFVEKVPFELVYFFPWQDGKKSAAPVLAYHFAGSREMELDAVSGQLMYSDWMASRPVTPDKPAVPQEHWASMSLALLSESGLLPTGEGVDPDGAVTRRDAVRVLVGAISRYYNSGDGEETPAFSDIGHSDRDFEAVQLAVRMGVLTGGGEFKPNEPLTRETMAAWLVRALGYEEVAKMTIKIELPVKDTEQVDVSLLNHVAIINGLGLMTGMTAASSAPWTN